MTVFRVPIIYWSLTHEAKDSGSIKCLYSTFVLGSFMPNNECMNEANENIKKPKLKFFLNGLYYNLLIYTWNYVNFKIKTHLY